MRTHWGMSDSFPGSSVTDKDFSMRHEETMAARNSRMKEMLPHTEP